MSNSAAEPSVGQGNLISYLNTANDISEIAVKHHSSSIELLVQMDEMLKQACVQVAEDQPIPSGLLNVNCRILFLSAVRIAMSGHVAPLHPLLRASLESAYYAQAIAIDPSLGSIWMRGARDKESRKARHQAFSGKILDQVGERLKSELIDADKLIRDLYQRHIDNGAHPNASGIFFGMEIGETQDQWLLNISAGSSTTIDHALYVCFDSAIFSALIIANWPEVPKTMYPEFKRLMTARNTWEDRLAAAHRAATK